MQLAVHPYVLPLRDTFRIAHESRTEQPTLIVELRDEASRLAGYGEAPMTRYYGLDSAHCTAQLTELAPAFAPLAVDQFAPPAFLSFPPAPLRNASLERGDQHSLVGAVHLLIDEVAPDLN
ncbi:MAG: hypothetical protein AAGA62_16435, partial [Bacteroidota bacterium]